MDKIGINDAIPIARKVTIRNSAPREYIEEDAMNVPLKTR